MKNKLLRKIIGVALSCCLTAGIFTGCAASGEDNTEVTETEIIEYELPDAPVSAEVSIAALDNMRDDFVRGMDISTLLTQEASGVKYYDENGQEEDLIELLARYGVNYVRVRVWNDPYDENGNGYGGGNCDAQTAAEIGARAAKYAMKTNVDFHYSDFWADPKKQKSPKAWEGMSIEEKSQAIYDYTVESLSLIIDSGADVGMVQIGNEINNGMSGEKSDENVVKLLKSASKAVRDVSKDKNKDIKIAVHYTNISDVKTITKKALLLSENEVDYDIFGVSYYQFWHGTLTNMKNILNTIKSVYGKEVMVLETSFPYTDEDGDGFGNTISSADIVGDYISSVQSQTDAVWDVFEAVNEIGGLGVFYWEGAWTPVGDNYESNMEKWNEYGSGWASKYSTDYDPNDAGLYYGGCAWDNQAFFDAKGNVLPSLNIFRCLKVGTNCEKKLEFIKDTTVECLQGENANMPETVYAVYNIRSLSEEVPVEWIDEADTSEGGEFIINGEANVPGFDEKVPVTAKLIVNYANLLQDSSFEDGSSVWVVGHEMNENPTDIQNKAADAHSGQKAFHFWSDKEDQLFWVEQTIVADEDADYNGFAYVQGGDAGSDYVVSLYIKINGEIVLEDTSAKLIGWKQWKKPEVLGISAKSGDEVTIGMKISCAKGGWGTIDDFCLYKN